MGQKTKTPILAKVGLAKVGQIRMAKVGLAKSASAAQLEAKFPTRGSEEAHQNLCARAAKRRAGVPCTEDAMPTSEQDIHEWMELKNQELRGALDMGDVESVTCLTDMISRGAKKIATAHRPPPSLVANMVM